MFGFIKKLSMLAMAGIAGITAYLYVTDQSVRTKVDAAAHDVANAAQEVGSAVKELKNRAVSSSPDPVQANRDATEEQWESLGI